MTSTGQIDFEEQRIQAFPTHLFQRRYTGMEGMHRTMLELVFAKEKGDAGVERSNVGGWHSESDLLQWQSPAVTVLTALIQDAAHQCLAWQLGRDPSSFSASLKLEAWANVVRAGHYHRPHIHPGAHLALVYYVDAGDAPAEEPYSGVVELLDPRGRASMLPIPGHPLPDSVSLKPSSGLLQIFPAWMVHHVHPYRGERPRVCIGCNVTITGLTEAS